METLVENCCGLDVHQSSIVACVLVGPANARKPEKKLKSFGTTTRELVALRDWLTAEGCTAVGMESTGVYWKPVHAVLEDHLKVILGNAQRMKNVPGRKTDMKDAEWIAHLVRFGMVSPSFVPPRPLRDLRDLLRYRTKLVQVRSAEENRLIALLEKANVKLSSVMARVISVSGKQTIRAMIAGETDPSRLADLAKGRLRQKRPELRLALEGRIEEHHRFVLEMQLDRIERAESDIERIDQRIDEKLVEYRAVHARLMQIPGVDRVVAAVIIAEIGVDMSAFHGAKQLASWAGLCPGNHESAGKRFSGRTRKGNAYLRAMLVQAATSAGRTKGTYLQSKYQKLRSRIGPKRAALAIAHRMLISAYQMISKRQDYAELGPAYLDGLNERRTLKNLIKRIEGLGFQVQIEKSAA